MLSAASDGLESTRRQELGVMKELRVLSSERPLEERLFFCVCQDSRNMTTHAWCYCPRIQLFISSRGSGRLGRQQTGSPGLPKSCRVACFSTAAAYWRVRVSPVPKPLASGARSSPAR